MTVGNGAIEVHTLEIVLAGDLGRFVVDKGSVSLDCSTSVIQKYKVCGTGGMNEAKDEHASANHVTRIPQNTEVRKNVFSSTLRYTPSLLRHNDDIPHPKIDRSDL